MKKKGLALLKGELFILGGALTGSLLPILCNPKSILISPLWMVALGTIISFFVFLIIFLYKGLHTELKKTPAIKLSALAGLIIGFFYTGLVYIGSYYTSPQNASIIVTMDVFVAMLLLRRLDSEKLSLAEIIGGTLLVSAGAVLFLPASAKPNLGDLVLLAACFLTPIGNLIMKRARTAISSETILLVRTAIAGSMLSLMALVFTGVPNIENLKDSAVPVILNGLLVLSLSKILWIEGINLIPIAKASSIMSISPVLTFIFAWIFLNDAPDLNQILAVLIALFGLKLVLSRTKSKPIKFLPND